MGRYSRANVHYEPRETYADAWARTINEYWKLPNVAKPMGYTNVTSTMRHGVPTHTYSQYDHPAIVRVRRFGHKWSIVK